MTLPAQVPVKQAAKFIGFPSNCLLRRFIREGLLPYPDQQTYSFGRDDVLALKAYLDAKRIGNLAVPRPDHRS